MSRITSIFTSTSMLLRVRVLVILFGVGACAPDQSPSPNAATAATVSIAEFRSLHWYEGRWLGEQTEGSRFFEAYRVLDDSTIRKYTFADSNYAGALDSGSIALRGGRVTSSSGDRSWVVTAIDTASVSFGPWRGASNAFTWTRTGPGAWSARLSWDSAGVPREVVYSMRAVP